MRLNEIQCINNCIQKQNDGYFINLQEYWLHTACIIWKKSFTQKIYMYIYCRTAVVFVYYVIKMYMLLLEIVENCLVHDADF